MAREQHLTYFKVENFKKFDSLELTDIGQFNLIVGDNNVGKTSLLESLLFDTDGKKMLKNLHTTLCARNFHIHPIPSFEKGKLKDISIPSVSYLSYLLHDREKPVLFNFQLKGKDKKSILKLEQLNWEGLTKKEQKELTGKFPPDAKFFVRFQNSENKSKVSWLYSEDFGGETHPYIPFVPTHRGLYDALIKYYKSTIGKSTSEYEDFLDSLRVLIPDIIAINPQTVWGTREIFVVRVKSGDEQIPLSRFGDSVASLLVLLVEIQMAKGGVLVIDEVENGFHYTRIKDVLKTVFLMASKNNVQLYMTTHSLECQQAFVEVFEDPEMVSFQKDARQFSLIETPEKQIVAQGFDFEQLQSALETGFDTRGGKRGW